MCGKKSGWRRNVEVREEAMNMAEYTIASLRNKSRISAQRNSRCASVQCASQTNLGYAKKPDNGRNFDRPKVLGNHIMHFAQVVIKLNLLKNFRCNA